MMKLAIVLMLTFCLFLQTQARNFEEEIPSSNEVSEKQKDLFSWQCVQDYCAYPFKPCCKEKNEDVYCLAHRCLKIKGYRV